MLDKLIEMVNLLIGPPDARMEKKRKLVKLWLSTLKTI